jgi:hypothetical protein
VTPITVIDGVIMFGDEPRKVTISQPSGAGGAYYIRIDDFHIGQIVRQQGVLNAFLNPYPDLTGDDLQIVFELIEEAEKKDQK